MQVNKDERKVLRRFVASAAASVQSRKRVRSAFGYAPFAAEMTHGKILTANFSSGINDDGDGDGGGGGGTKDDILSRVQQLTAVENVWTAEATIELRPGSPDAGPVPTDIFSLTEPRHRCATPYGVVEVPEGHFFYAPAKFRCSDPLGWTSFKEHIQQAGYLGGTQLTAGGKTASGKESDASYLLQCFRRRYDNRVKSKVPTNDDSSTPSTDNSKKRGYKRRKIDRPQAPEDECPCFVKVFVDSERDRFYFKSGIGCNIHCKHTRFLPHEIAERGLVRGVKMIRPGKFVSYIRWGDKQRYIGTFDTDEQASTAYESMRKDLNDADLSAIGAAEVEAMFDEARKKAVEEVGGVIPKKMTPRSDRGLPTGVYDVSSGRFESSIKWGGKTRSIGTFDTPEEASAAYASVKKDLANADFSASEADEVDAAFGAAKKKAADEAVGGFFLEQRELSHGVEEDDDGYYDVPQGYI